MANNRKTIELIQYLERFAKRFSKCPIHLLDVSQHINVIRDYMESEFNIYSNQDDDQLIQELKRRGYVISQFKAGVKH